MSRENLCNLHRIPGHSELRVCNEITYPDHGTQKI